MKLSELHGTKIEEGSLSNFAKGAAIGASALIGGDSQATAPKQAPSVPHIQSDNSIKPYFNDLIKWEGKKYKVYPDSNGIKTIGVGFNLEQPSAKKTIESFGLNYGDILSGRASINDDIAMKLVEHEISGKISLAKRLLPDFGTYPEQLKIAIVNGLYRGDLSQSPKTIHLMKANKWHDAAKEYLNNAEYKNTDRRQIKDRMNTNAKVFSSYSPQIRK